jgi:hypothetical protein
MVRSERFSARMCRSNDRAKGDRVGFSMTPQEVKTADHREPMC